MLDLLRLMRLRLGGTLGMIPGAAFATGEVSAAQLANIPCDVTREGEERRIPGSTGVASRKVRCEYTGSAWAWGEVGVAAVDAAYVEKAGDTMTGTLDVQASGLFTTRFSASANGANFIGQKSRSNTVGVHTAAQSGDLIVTLRGDASDGTAYRQAGRIAIAATGTITSGNVPGRLRVDTVAEGGGTSLVERWGSSAVETVFNDTGTNTDFRVEGDTDANLVFVDASTDFVGIGTASPASKLDVNGEIRGTSIVNTGVRGIYQDSDYTGSNVNTAQQIFGESTNGAATVTASTAYLLDAIIHIHTTGTTSHDLRLIFNAGTCTFTSFDYSWWTHVATPPATEISAIASNSWASAATETIITAAAATATHHTIMLKGIVRVNGGGTLIPQYRWSAAPGAAGVTLRGSYLTLTPFGTNTTVTVGTWT